MRLTLLVLVVVAPLLGRSIFEARKAFQLGEASEDPKEKAHFFGLSVGWGFVGNVYSQNAERELWKLTEDPSLSSEERLQYAEKLQEGLWSSRSFLKLDQDTKLSKVAKLIEALHPEPVKVREDSLRQPKYFFQIAALIAFILWTGAIILGIWKGFSAQLQPNWKVLGSCSLLAFSSYILWLSFLARA